MFSFLHQESIPSLLPHRHLVTAPTSHINTINHQSCPHPSNMMEHNPKRVEERVENAPPPMVGHMMAPHDPANPMNWPVLRKTYVSAVAWAFSFVVAFGATAYTAGISEVMKKFDISMTTAILGLSLYLLGIAFAPLTTPHLSEAFGRSIVYMISIPVFSLFILGAGLSQNFAGVAACRFFAGFTGGPCLVLIEGTFADVWHTDVTGTFYSVLAISSYIGAATGPLVGGFVFAAKGWRWTQWITLMLALAAYLLGIGMPETYPREIMRQRSKRTGIAQNMPKAPSGVSLREQLQVTLFTPVSMLFVEPIVIIATIYLGFNFAVIFSLFIVVPAVLSATYSFSIGQVGLAFIAAIVGSILSALTSIIIDRLTYPKQLAKCQDGSPVDVEYRLYPAMIGGFGITISLFWIGWTASPTIGFASPILGTLLYVWGNQSVLIALITYLFEAYPPRGTLSALTAAASLRLSLAAILPLVIIQMITGLTGAWAFSLFGFLSAAMIPIPFILFKYGPALRARSKHSNQKMMGKQAAEMNSDLEKQSSGSMEAGMMNSERADASMLGSTTKWTGGRSEVIEG